MQELEILRDIDNANIYIVAGPLFRDPAVVVYVDTGNIDVFDTQLSMRADFKLLDKRFKETSPLVFLTIVGEDARVFYNRELE